MRPGGCLLLMVACGVGMIGVRRQEGHVSAARLQQQVVEDSLMRASFKACDKAVPEAGFTLHQLVQRAPGRWQVIKRGKADQLICTAWQGRLQSVDTAIIQPGNGQLNP